MTDLDWTTLIPTTIEVLPSSEIKATYHRLYTPEEELLAEPKTFTEYVETLPLTTRRLLYQLHFVPGGERMLRECLESNRRLKAASDGSLDPDAALELAVEETRAARKR